MALAALVAAFVLGYRWDAATNRGHTWGYWGEFNTVSNSLAKLPGVTRRLSGERLQKALTDDDADVRAAAAAALRAIGGPLSRDELLALLKDRQQPVARLDQRCPGGAGRAGQLRVEGGRAVG